MSPSSAARSTRVIRLPSLPPACASACDSASISFSKFLSFVLRFHPREKRAEHCRLWGGLSRVFEGLDHDRDGVLSAQELASAYAKEGIALGHEQIHNVLYSCTLIVAPSSSPAAAAGQPSMVSDSSLSAPLDLFQFASLFSVPQLRAIFDSEPATTTAAASTNPATRRRAAILQHAAALDERAPVPFKDETTPAAKNAAASTPAGSKGPKPGISVAGLPIHPHLSLSARGSVRGGGGHARADSEHLAHHTTDISLASEQQADAPYFTQGTREVLLALLSADPLDSPIPASDRLRPDLMDGAPEAAARAAQRRQQGLLDQPAAAGARAHHFLERAIEALCATPTGGWRTFLEGQAALNTPSATTASSTTAAAATNPHSRASSTATASSLNSTLSPTSSSPMRRTSLLLPAPSPSHSHAHSHSHGQSKSPPASLAPAALAAAAPMAAAAAAAATPTTTPAPAAHSGTESSLSARRSKLAPSPSSAAAAAGADAPAAAATAMAAAATAAAARTTGASSTKTKPKTNVAPRSKGPLSVEVGGTGDGVPAIEITPVVMVVAVPGQLHPWQFQDADAPPPPPPPVLAPVPPQTPKGVGMASPSGRGVSSSTSSRSRRTGGGRQGSAILPSSASSSSSSPFSASSPSSRLPPPSQLRGGLNSVASPRHSPAAAGRPSSSSAVAQQQQPGDGAASLKVVSSASPSPHSSSAEIVAGLVAARQLVTSLAAATGAPGQDPTRSFTPRAILPQQHLAPAATTTAATAAAAAGAGAVTSEVDLRHTEAAEAEVEEGERSLTADDFSLMTASDATGPQSPRFGLRASNHSSSHGAGAEEKEEAATAVAVEESEEQEAGAEEDGDGQDEEDASASLQRSMQTPLDSRPQMVHQQMHAHGSHDPEAAEQLFQQSQSQSRQHGSVKLKPPVNQLRQLLRSTVRHLQIERDNPPPSTRACVSHLFVRVACLLAFCVSVCCSQCARWNSRSPRRAPSVSCTKPSALACSSSSG